MEYLMGECGCCNNWPQFKFRGPDGTFYGVAISTGCDECGTDAGIDIVKIDVAAYGELNVQRIPDLPFEQEDGNRAGVAVVGREALAKAIIATAKGLMVEDDYEFDGLIEDSLPEALLEAVSSTFNAWAKKTATETTEVKR